MKTSKLISLLVLPLFGCIFFGFSAHATTISPVVVDQSLTPGMSASGKMMVTNDTSNPQTYYVSIQSFVPMGEEGEQQFLDEADVKGLPSWFQIPEKSFTLAASQSKEINYTIDAPLNAEPGGHYAAVFFSTTPENAGQGSSIGIGAKTGIIFLVSVAGNVKEAANIESFTVNQSVFSSLPAMMSLRIRNTGSIHFRPTGTLEVRNMWGGVVARVPANPKKSAVLPNSIRRLDTWWAKSPDVAKGGFFAGLSNEWNNFALGRYTAKVDVKYGSQNTPLEAKTISFWVFPWRMFLVLLGIIVILLLGMKLYNKMIISSALKAKHKK